MKQRPIRHRVVKKRKDFIRTKFSGPLTRPETLARRRRHHSRYNPPGGLRQTRVEWTHWAILNDVYQTGERGWRCDTRGCQNHGFGPMLRTLTWKRRFAGRTFQCEPCMVRVLGRPLNCYDLRACQMNFSYPFYDDSLVSR